MKKRWLSVLLALSMMLTFLPSSALAETTEIVAQGSCGTSITWTLDSAGILTISGSGKMPNYTAASYVPWHKKEINTVIIQDGIASICNYAFTECSMTSVTIPESVTSIGNYAFWMCRNLNSVTIPDSVTAIGEFAFHGCDSLGSITIPSSVSSISTLALAACSSLGSIDVHPNNPNYTSINGILFDKSLTTLVQYPAGKQETSYAIPDGVTTIGEYAFDDCKALTNITIPSGVTSINSSAFDGCSGLMDITIPDGVTSIAYGTFSECRRLTNITIPNSVTSIGKDTFLNCVALSSITIPDSVITIGDRAFGRCTGLTSVTIPNGVTSIGSDAFDGCSALINATIPGSVASIRNYAFRDCFSLSNVTISNGVTSIGNYAFQNCSKLNSITFPNSVTSIGEYAFSKCSGITSMIIPDSVIFVGNYAFENCSGLTDVYYSGSETQWAAISQGTGNGSLFYRATIHYNSTGPADTPYDVTYVLNGGTGEVPAECWRPGELVYVIEQIPTKAGYTFKGWSDGTTTYQPGDTFTMPADDVTLTAVWEASDPSPDEITALYPANGSTFDFSDSTADTRMRIFFDREVSNTGGNRPELDFSVGTLEIHKVSDDSVVYQVQYGTEVSQWNVDGSPTAVVLQNASSALGNGTEYYVTMPAGFIKFADGTVSPAIGKGDWQFTTKGNGSDPTPATHSFTYMPNGGTMDIPYVENHLAGDVITIADAPIRNGYLFKGWIDNTTTYQPGDTFTMPDRDVILAATWEAIPGDYAVTYQLNGGIGDIPSECWTAGETVTIIAQVPTRNGYVFGGWSDGSTTYQPGDTFTMPDHDVTLKAEWTTETAEMQYVKHITETSLAGVDETVKASIQNAMYNLLFKATFRPTEGPAIAGIPAVFTDSGKIPMWHPQNHDPYGDHVEDAGLARTVYFSESAGGCRAYALFAMSYIYGADKPGDAKPFYKASSTLTDLRVFIETHMLPGAMMTYYHSGGLHSIVYLGENGGKTGFYYISYEGGLNEAGTNAYHQMTVKFDTFEQFYAKIYSLSVRDQHKNLDASRTIIRVECPVEARVILGNEELDSRSAPDSNNFGTVCRDGEAIIFDLEYNKDYRLEIIGTGEGYMDLTVEYQDESGDTLNTRGFQNISIEDDAQIDSYGFDASGLFILYQNLGEDDERIWGASINQTVTEPNKMLSSKYNVPDLEGDPDIPTDYTISVQPSGTASTTDIKVNGQTAATANEGDTVVVTPAAAEAGKRLNVTAAAGSSAVDVTDNGDGTYSFTMPAANVTVTVETATVYALTLTQPATLAGSATLDKTTAAVGDTVTVTVTSSTGFECIGIAVLNDGKQNVSVFENKDADGEVISYYFKMPANPKNVEVIPIMQAGTTATCVYSNSGNFGGQLSFSNLTAGGKYVVQVAKTKDAAHAIMFITANADGTAVVDVLRNPNGYVVDLFVYDKAITVTPTYSQLTTVPVTVTTAK